jgi:hypothetical protein
MQPGNIVANYREMIVHTRVNKKIGKLVNLTKKVK